MDNLSGSSANYLSDKPLLLVPPHEVFSMRLFPIAALCLLFVDAAAAAEPIPLFDGKSLDGWEGNLDWFRVEEGAIVAGSHEKAIPRNEFLCTKQRYGDFELRFEAQLVGQGQNAGVQFRSERIPNHHEMKGYQCDIGVGQGRPIWGSLYDESRRRTFLAQGDAEEVAAALAKAKDGWNRFVVRCEGPRIRIWLNDVLTVDYQEKVEGIPEAGLIGLQIHSGPPAEAKYRAITLKRL